MGQGTIKARTDTPVSFLGGGCVLEFTSLQRHCDVHVFYMIRAFPPK